MGRSSSYLNHCCLLFNIKITTKMAGAQHTVDAVLSEVITSISSLSIETHPNSTSTAQSKRLLLLHPLVSAEMLSACRNPNSRFLRDCQGSIVRPSNQETLDIRPLGRAWRQAITNLAPVCDITLDLTLPSKEIALLKESQTRPLNEDLAASSQELYWEDTIPLKR